MIRLSSGKTPKIFGPISHPSQAAGSTVDYVLTHNLNTKYPQITSYGAIAPANTVIFVTPGYSIDGAGQIGNFLLNATPNAITARVSWLFASNTTLYFRAEAQVNPID